MNLVLEIFSWFFLLSGGVVVIIGAMGVLRLPDFFTRLHASSVIDTLGCMLIILGLVLQAGLSLITIKLILIVIFILFTTPASAHALAKAALHGKLFPQFIDKSGEPISKP